MVLFKTPRSNRVFHETFASNNLLKTCFYNDPGLPEGGGGGARERKRDRVREREREREKVRARAPEIETEIELESETERQRKRGWCRVLVDADHPPFPEPRQAGRQSEKECVR